MANDLRHMAERGAALLGGELVSSSSVAGGDLSAVVEIEMSNGCVAIVKGGPAPDVEAEMLEAIRATGAPTPCVLAQDASVLVLEVLPGGGRLSDACRDLGQVLSTLHGARGPRYGWNRSYAFGSVEIDNAWADDWPEFWAERRLRTQVSHLPGSLARQIASLADDLSNRLPAKPEPSLLHGDLWGGNVMVENGRVSGLIDPACYYGDREVDFAMLGLFDRPGESLFDACDTLDSGHGERLPIYQLWPALVHLRLFGSGYRSMVERLLALLGV